MIAHIETWEPKLKALYAPDFEGARKAAKASEKRWQAGAPQGALDGVPITIKENIATQGVPVPLGTAATQLVPAAADAPASARVREAGAVILAKTTTAGLRHAVLGPQLLPSAGRAIPGTSPGIPEAPAPAPVPRRRPATAPLHLGTDIGGSVRLPASWNGIFTLKPSLGRVPVDPPFFGRAVGPMTRTVADSALLMAELSKPDPRDYMACRRPRSTGAPGRSIPGASRSACISMPARAWPSIPRSRRRSRRRRRNSPTPAPSSSPWRRSCRPRCCICRDLFWRVAQLGRFLGLEPRPASQRAALHRRLVPRRRRCLGRGGDQGGQQLHGDPRRHDAGDAALRLCAVAGVARCRPIAPNGRRRPTTVKRPLEHISFTMPYNMSEQRRPRSIADTPRTASRSIADRRPSLRRQRVMRLSKWFEAAASRRRNGLNRRSEDAMSAATAKGPLGILMLDTRFPRIVGDIGNAASFDFPVIFRRMEGIGSADAVTAHPDRRACWRRWRPMPRRWPTKVRSASRQAAASSRSTRTIWQRCLPCRWRRRLCC